MKEKTTAYILWSGCFLGLCGLHRIYSGKIGTGFLWLFTFGLLGIGQLVDLFAIPSMVQEANARAVLLSLGGQQLAGALPAQAAPRTAEELAVALVKAAEERGGSLSVTEGVAATGRSFKDVERALRAMAVDGYVEVDNDPESGVLLFRFRELG